MATIIRKNQKNLTAAEWQAFIDAIHATHGMGIPLPAYRDFVQVHVRAMNMQDPEGMSWGVHTMGPMMPGRNFLAWHRRFLVKLEARLRLVDPSVSIPYWDWITDRTIPSALDKPSLLTEWGVTRSFDASQLPTAQDVSAATTKTTFATFQPSLEGGAHNAVHRAVGGTMRTASSPADALFWLHHANIDRIWAQWQTAHPGKKPSNLTETLKPTPIFGVKVSSVLSISTLGYKYA